MINVELKAETRAVEKTDKDELLALASHAALECYQAKPPEFGKTIDIENRLFRTGHHTTLEHHNFTFHVEGIAVSDITFGAHLCSPFYNSDQRSGRFCAEMFTNPDFESIENYISTLWPEVRGSRRGWIEVANFIRNGVDIYSTWIDDATKLAAELIAKERPRASADYIRLNAPKIAQEQLRMFIPSIFPTGFDFTVDLIALVSLYKAAWTPGLRELTKQMELLVLERHPEIAYMFLRRGGAWTPLDKFFGDARGCIDKEPRLRIIDSDISDVAVPDPGDAFPVDLLHFLPDYMGNNVRSIKTEVEISVVCMGQDQRHRTISRGVPSFTSNFYLPPVPALLPKVPELARITMESWRWISKMVPPTLTTALAPYGAMVRYEKRGSLNAIFHEQAKRLCWCAQEEIYHLSRHLRQELERMCPGMPFLKAFEPMCSATGKCAEGARYCGRDISLRESGDYFPVRKV